MDPKQIKKEFFEHLPRGYASIIEKRLAAKKISFTRQYITSVCNPEKNAFEADIVSEAIELANETKVKLEELATRAQSLNTKPVETEEV